MATILADEVFHDVAYKSKDKSKSANRQSTSDNPPKTEEWHPVEEHNKALLSHKKQSHQEAYLVTLAPGIDIHDLDGCTIDLASIAKCSPETAEDLGLEDLGKKREELVNRQSRSIHKHYKFEDPMTDTKLEDKSRVKRLERTGGTDHLLAG